MPNQNYDPAAVRAELEKYRAQKDSASSPRVSSSDIQAELQRYRAQKAASVPREQQQSGGLLDTAGHAAVSVGKSIASGLADVVLQPARAVQQLGSGLGNLVASKVPLPGEKYLASKLGFTKENSQGISKALHTNAVTGEVKPVENLKQTAGVGVQAAANLSTPFVGGPLKAIKFLGPAAKLAIQGAALGGGRAAEMNKSGGDIAFEAGMNGLISGALPSVTKGIGKVISKGRSAITEPAANMTKNAIKKAFPSLTNIPKADVDWALKNQDKVLPKIKYIRDAVAAGEPDAAEATIREELLNKARTVASSAKAYAQQNYENGLNAIADKFKGMKIDRVAAMDKALSTAASAGPVLNADEKMAYDAVKSVLSGSGDDTIRGTIKLKQDLSSVMDRLEEGSPAMRLASAAWDAVDDQLNKITGGEMRPLNSAYAEFKHAMQQVRPAWSRNVNDDTALSFVSKLGTSSKTGAMKAIKTLEKIAGMSDSPLSNELKAASIAKKMNWEKAPPGSRMRDDLTRGAIQAVGTGIGGTFGGWLGASAGQSATGALASKVTSPAYLSNFIFDEAEKKVGKMAGPVRQAIADVISSPGFTQALQRLQLEGWKNVSERK